MFGRCCFSIVLLLLMVFASSSNAKQCKKYQMLSNGNLKGEEAIVEDCVGCSGYICKTPDGEYIRGGDCTDKIEFICKDHWSEDLIKLIAEKRWYRYVNEFFAFSCPTNGCNGIEWMKDRLHEYEEHIKKSRLALEDNKDAAVRGDKDAICICK